jgi:hypothetical protein
LSSLDPERRSRLLGVKLGALARDHLHLTGELSPFPAGAAVRGDDRRGAVLAEDMPGRSLGPAIAWASRHDVEELHLLVEDAAGMLARRAAAFAAPPRLWWVQGRDLHPVEAEPVPARTEPSSAALAYVPQLVAAGCDVVVEHGSVIGEVLGLEVARVVEQASGTPRLEVGVGRHDREAFAIIHGDVPTDTALASVVDTVRRYRRSDTPQHALHRLAAERWLCQVVVADPAIVGAARLEPAEGPMPRPNVKDPWPAVATGEQSDGSPVVVVCSVGIDLDLVPYAADARLELGAEGRLVLVVPERDAHPVTRQLAAALTRPAELVTVTDDWRSLPS